jgi:hypothetical protein
MFDRDGGHKLKRWIDEGVISSISIWQIDRSGKHPCSMAVCKH